MVDNIRNKLAIGVVSTAAYQDRFQRIYDKWGKNIQKHIYFFSDYSDPYKNVIKVTDDKSYHSHVIKTKEGFKWFHDNKINDYKWFMMIDDDTYVFVEALLSFISTLDNHNENVGYGTIINAWADDPNLQYFSGGAGYILSTKTLDTIYPDLDITPTICGDVNIGYILFKNKIQQHQNDKFLCCYPYNIDKLKPNNQDGHFSIHRIRTEDEFQMIHKYNPIKEN